MNDVAKNTTSVLSKGLLVAALAIGLNISVIFAHPEPSNDNHIAVVAYSTDAVTVCDFANDRAKLKRSISALQEESESSLTVLLSGLVSGSLMKRGL